MNKNLHSIIRQASRKMLWSPNARTRKRIIKKFADKIGLIYFGFVNQHSDDHKIIRGFTVSASHQDNHYSVGSFDGYDVSIVDRCDAIWQPDNSIKTFNWLIMAFDLHTVQDIPHFFLNALNHDPKPYASLFTTFPALKEIGLGTFEDYGIEFTSRFSIYAKPTDSIQIERLIPANTARILGAHFWPLSIEQHENVLYIYSDIEHVTSHLLDTMLENGLWLARFLDSQAELV